MPKEEWGVKRLCPQCGSRFYDLNKDPMTCPVCGTSLTLESMSASGGPVLVSDKNAPRNGAGLDASQVADEDLDEASSDVELDDDLLDEEDDDDVSLDEIADVGKEDEDHDR